MQKINLSWILAGLLTTLGAAAHAGDFALQITLLDGQPAGAERAATINEQLKAIYGADRVRQVTLSGGVTGRDVQSEFNEQMKRVMAEEGGVKALVIQGPVRVEGSGLVSIEPLGRIPLAKTPAEPVGFDHLGARLDRAAPVSIIGGDSLSGPNAEVRAREVMVFLGASEGYFYGENADGIGRRFRVTAAGFESLGMNANGPDVDALLRGTAALRKSASGTARPKSPLVPPAERVEFRPASAQTEDGIAVLVAIVDGTKVTDESVNAAYDKMSAAHPGEHVRLVKVKKPALMKSVDATVAQFKADLNALTKSGTRVKALVIQGAFQVIENLPFLMPFGTFNLRSPHGCAKYWAPLQGKLIESASVSFIDGEILRGVNSDLRARDIMRFFGATKGYFFGQDETHLGRRFRTDGSPSLGVGFLSEPLKLGGGGDLKIFGRKVGSAAVHVAIVDGQIVTPAAMAKAHQDFKFAHPNDDVVLIIRFAGLETDAQFEQRLADKIASLGQINALLVQSKDPAGTMVVPLRLRLAPEATVAMIGAGVLPYDPPVPETKPYRLKEDFGRASVMMSKGLARGGDYEALQFARNTLCFLGASRGSFFGQRVGAVQAGTRIRVSNEGLSCEEFWTHQITEIFTCAKGLVK